MVQARSDRQNFKAPFCVVSVSGCDKQRLFIGYKCLDDAGMTMHKVRSGTDCFSGDGQKTDVRLTKKIRNGELRVEDTNGEIVFRMKSVE